LREKNGTARELLYQALLLRKLTRKWGALFFVNDRLDVGLASDADGVHLGPEDLPVAAVRATAPPGFLIGYSTDDPKLARQAAADGADYIGCGAVYPTATKRDTGDVIGVEGLARVASAVEIPVIGIGGVTPLGAGEIAAKTRAAGVAVIGAVMTAERPGEVVKELLAPFEQ
jgi:thiamine-phosphate pyrophosphorylase